MGAERQALRTTFDSVAGRYERARPDYPPELFDELVRTTRLSAGDRVLEIGCATGKATRPLAERGLEVVAVELGAGLAAVARASLAEFPHVEIVHADFEAWEPGRSGFDAVVAATAWHWLDPRTRYRRAFDLLRPGGWLAFWSAAHVFPEGGDGFFLDIQEVYDAIGEGLPEGARWPQPGGLANSRAEIVATGLFDEVTVTQFDWEVVYDADQYIDLLETFSGHIAMARWKRDHLFAEIRLRMRDRPGGSVRRHWGAALHVARRPCEAGEDARRASGVG